MSVHAVEAMCQKNSRPCRKSSRIHANLQLSLDRAPHTREWDTNKCYATEMYEDEACSDGSLNLSDGDGERGRAEEGRGGGLVGELGFDGDERNGGGGLLVVAHFSLSTDHVPITFPRQEAACCKPDHWPRRDDDRSCHDPAPANSGVHMPRRDMDGRAQQLVAERMLQEQ